MTLKTPTPDMSYAAKRQVAEKLERVAKMAVRVVDDLFTGRTPEIPQWLYRAAEDAELAAKIPPSP